MKGSSLPVRNNPRFRAPKLRAMMVRGHESVIAPQHRMPHCTLTTPPTLSACKAAAPAWGEALVLMSVGRSDVVSVQAWASP